MVTLMWTRNHQTGRFRKCGISSPFAI